MKLVTAQRRCRLLEMGELVDEDDVAPPTYFISHTCEAAGGGMCASTSIKLASVKDTGVTYGCDNTYGTGGEGRVRMGAGMEAGRQVSEGEQRQGVVVLAVGALQLQVQVQVQVQVGGCAGRSPHPHSPLAFPLLLPAGKNRHSRLLEQVLGYLASAAEGVAVWIDILAVNQHEDTRAHRADIAAFAE